MLCEICGHALTKGANFCTKCGAKISSRKNTCPECGTEFREDQVFCEQCGAVLKKHEHKLPEPDSVKHILSGKLKRVHFFIPKPQQSFNLMITISMPFGELVSAGVVNLELTSDSMMITNAPSLYRHVSGNNSVLYSDIQSIKKEGKMYVFSLKSGDKLYFSAHRPEAVTFFTNIQSSIETGG